MFRRLIVAAAFAAFVGMGTVAAANDGVTQGPYEGHRVVRARILDQQQLEILETLSPDRFSATDFRIPPENMEALRRSGIEFEVLVENLQVMIDAERARLDRGGAGGPDGGWYDDFKDFDAIVAKLTEWAVMHPGIVELMDIGDSIEGRNILALRITGPGTGKPVIVYNGTQHAREWIVPMVTMYIADNLINQYGVDPQITALVDAVEFLIVPMVNPDGYEWSWGPERLWRKNRRDNGDGTFGVDLNRNWSVGWGGPGSSGVTSSETYRGTAPFSEPESTALRDLALAHPNLVSHIDFHSYGQLILRPYSFDYVEPPPPDSAIMAQIGDAMADAIFAVHGKVYDSVPGYELYLASGVCNDWFYDEGGAFAWTIELRPVGSPGFILPPEEIIPNCQEMLPAVLLMAEATTAGVMFDFPYGLPAIIEAGVTSTVTIDIVPITAGPLDPASAMFYWRTGPADPFTASPMTHLGGDSYEATFPALDCGLTVQYYFQIDSDAGETFRSPENAPDGFYEAEVLDITVYFHDDFETSLGWTVENSPTLTDGAWDRGIPVDCERGDPPTDADGSSQCSLTDNSAANDCNSDVDGGTTTLISPTMDASDPDAVIEYYRWFSNNYGGSPYEDIFQVEVSDDDGATWTELETVGPAGPEVTGGWYYKQFLVADIPGIANTDLFRIRFSASDLGSGSVVEAGVDGVSLLAFGCGSAVPGDVNGDGTVNVEDLLMVLAAWGPCTGCPEDLNGDGTVNVLDLLEVLGNWS